MGIFSIPSIDTLVTEIKAKIKELRPGAATGPGSAADIDSQTLGHIGHGLHLQLLYGVLHQLIPTKASGWALDAWAWLFGLSDGSGGFGRIVPRPSYVDAGFTFVADTGPWVDLYETTFTSSGGLRFQINEHYTPTGAGTTPALDVLALQDGKAGNIEVLDGETYTWESIPTGMTSTITQTVDLDNGANLETDSELRARLVRLLQTPPMGGNWAGWEWVAEEAAPGNVDAWVWAGLHNSAFGFSCTDIACTQRGEYGNDKVIESTDALYTTISDALEAALPLGSFYRYRFLDSNADIQDVELTITPNPSAPDSARCDWDAETPKFTVFSYSVGNKTITCDAACTAYISVGDRVMIYSAQAVVSKVGIADGLAADTMFEVETWFDVYDAELNPFPWYSGYTPQIDHHVYSGGGMILDIVRKLRESTFGRLGPYKGTAGNAAPIPGWVDTLTHLQIQADVVAVGDALGDALISVVTIAVPAATSTIPNTGTDTDVFFLSPDEIVIWEVKP